MKKIITTLTLVCMMLSCIPSVSAKTVEEEAEVLYNLGLLKGTGGGFSLESLQLDRNATRAEMCTTIVRMLGKEEKAQYQQNPHPFNDVPDWAAANIGWLYENSLVNGVSDLYFGAQDIATVKQFSAMLLRVLGYYDSDGDFSYEDAVNFAMSKGLLTSDIANYWELSRSHMITMCYRALSTNIKNSSRLLSRKLCDEGALNENLALQYGVLSTPTLSDSFASVPETVGKIAGMKYNGDFVIRFDTPVEHYGVRVFMKELPSGAMRETSFEKGEIRYRNGEAAGYISDLRVHGLDTSKNYSFIVLKTTSEDANYTILGKSSVCDIY